MQSFALQTSLEERLFPFIQVSGYVGFEEFEKCLSCSRIPQSRRGYQMTGHYSCQRAAARRTSCQQGVHLVRHSIATTITLHYTQVVAFMCPQSKHHPILRFLRHLVLACVDFVSSMFAGDGSFALHVFVLATGCLLVYFGLPFLFQCGCRKGCLIT